MKSVFSRRVRAEEAKVKPPCTCTETKTQKFLEQPSDEVLSFAISSSLKKTRHSPHTDFLGNAYFWLFKNRSLLIRLKKFMANVSVSFSLKSVSTDCLKLQLKSSQKRNVRQKEFTGIHIRRQSQWIKKSQSCVSLKGRTHNASLRATLRHEVARNVADDGHTVKQLPAMLQK